MNFQLSFEKLGVPLDKRQTIFRYDDTNPEAESDEYIKSLREDVDWLGWQPYKVTFTSDYFQILYEYAIQLIKANKAFVCYQTKAEIEACRDIAKARSAGKDVPGNPCSPWRDRPVEDNLKDFNDMKNGVFDSNKCTLRLKMDMESPNPNMWDQVAYRIKYIPHPHAGDGWCIYPTYDYTHCIIDSLEHIDYSICTLEFETRRESYFWVLEALGLYRPKVYEMSRLNISHTLLSKRKLLKLVESKFMRGWDDPRMPTIKGLRRRGYTKEIINEFCKDIGATRTMNVVQIERLAAIARATLHEVSPRVMAVLNPLKVTIVNRTISQVSVPHYPFDPSRGCHSCSIEDVIYIDRNDFRIDVEDGYFGLAPKKVVNLKYAFPIMCESYEMNGDGEVVSLQCVAVREIESADAKPKTSIHWVSHSHSFKAEVREYNYLFTTEEPADETWEKELNPNSEVVYTSALLNSSILEWKLQKEMHFQFERVGFFVIDKESIIADDASKSKLVFNLTVNLKDSKPKAEVSTGKNKSRKEEQLKHLSEKMEKMKLNPVDMFRSQTDLYSQFDVDGLPTHDADAKEISKSLSKKLKKEWEKQKKVFEANV